VTGTIESWLGSLPEETVQAELAELEGRQRELQREIALRREALEIKRRWQEGTLASEPSQNGRAPESDENELFPDDQPYEDEDTRKRGKEAVLEIIGTAPNRSWSLGELIGEMVERGWAEDNEHDRHRLQVACSRMYRRKELRRMRPGVYRLHPRMMES
jgi:hypothetical protein